MPRQLHDVVLLRDELAAFVLQAPDHLLRVLVLLRAHSSDPEAHVHPAPLRAELPHHDALVEAGRVRVEEVVALLGELLRLRRHRRHAALLLCRLQRQVRQVQRVRRRRVVQVLDGLRERETAPVQHRKGLQLEPFLRRAAVLPYPCTTRVINTSSRVQPVPGNQILAHEHHRDAAGAQVFARRGEDHPVLRDVDLAAEQRGGCVRHQRHVFNTEVVVGQQLEALDGLVQANVDVGRVGADVVRPGTGRIQAAAVGVAVQGVALRNAPRGQFRQERERPGRRRVCCGRGGAGGGGGANQAQAHVVLLIGGRCGRRRGRADRRRGGGSCGTSTSSKLARETLSDIRGQPREVEIAARRPPHSRRTPDSCPFG
mmetsp:Transcript_17673/g.44150  ORF Transcript_17673/g.44150 Transcript_17673/m.44150 type:complete len:371 (-) Transcript_17673:774-1886(-)